MYQFYGNIGLAAVVVLALLVASCFRPSEPECDAPSDCFLGEYCAASEDSSMFGFCEESIGGSHCPCGVDPGGGCLPCGEGCECDLSGECDFDQDSQGPCYCDGDCDGFDDECGPDGGCNPDCGASDPDCPQATNNPIGPRNNGVPVNNGVGENNTPVGPIVCEPFFAPCGGPIIATWTTTGEICSGLNPDLQLPCPDYELEDIEFEGGSEVTYNVNGTYERADDFSIMVHVRFGPQCLAPVGGDCAQLGGFVASTLDPATQSVGCYGDADSCYCQIEDVQQGSYAGTYTYDKDAGRIESRTPDGQSQSWDFCSNWIDAVVSPVDDSPFRISFMLQSDR